MYEAVRILPATDAQIPENRPQCILWLLQITGNYGENIFESSERDALMILLPFGNQGQILLTDAAFKKFGGSVIVSYNVS